MFGERVAETTDIEIKTNDDGVPKALAWIPTTTSRSYDPTPNPSEMLKWEADIKPMIESCFNARDKERFDLETAQEIADRLERWQ